MLQSEEQSLVQRHTGRLQVKTPSFEAPIDGLSGGLSPGQAFQTVVWGLSFVTAADDILLLKTGAYGAPETLATPCTLRATGGPVTLFR